MQSMREWLIEQKAILLPKWLEVSFDVYPAEAANFLRKAGQFANPVGHSISEGLEMLYDGVAQGIGPENLQPAIDKIIRIRAVQDLPPDKAVAFIFELKKLLRQEFAKTEGGLGQELAAIESAIDGIALATFAIYSACREQLYQIRIAEIKKRQMLPQASFNS